MLRIIKIGMDVHSKTYSLCALEPKIGEEDHLLASTEVQADPKYILLFVESLKIKLGSDNDYDIVCGYEAGCLGYSLYNRLTAAGVKCVILAPTTMLTPQGKRVKTDARDARMIAQCLGNGGYRAVYIPTDEDDAVKEYIRMRDDQQDNLTRTKQQIKSILSPARPSLSGREMDHQAYILVTEARSSGRPPGSPGRIYVCL